MRRNLVLIAVIFCVVFASGVAAAGSVNRVIRVEVPFTFTVGNNTLPAGEYVVQMGHSGIGAALGSTLVLTRTATSASFVVRTLPAQNQEFRPEAKLVFHRYGDRYFLASAESYGLRSQLFTTPLEKELMARNSGAEKISVASD
jgi:hypothetical protein